MISSRYIGTEIPSRVTGLEGVDHGESCHGIGVTILSLLLIFIVPEFIYGQNCKDHPIIDSAGTEKLRAPGLEAPIALRQEIGNAHEKITAYQRTP
jgi:hypothetical protein